MDVVFAFILVIFTYQLSETLQISNKIRTFKQAIEVNVDTGIEALKDVF